MQQEMTHRQPEAIEPSRMDGAIAGVAVVDADVDLTRALGKSAAISLGEVIQTAPADSPVEHHYGQELVAGPSNSEPIAHEPPAADDDSIAYTVAISGGITSHVAGNEPLILGGQGGNSPATVTGVGFTIGSTAPGSTLSRAAA